jgi:AraC-like DNA-binding protein
VLGPDVAAALLDALAAGVDPHALLLRAPELGSVRELCERAAIMTVGRPHGGCGPAGDLGIGARQLQRRVTDAVGYGANTLQHVLRFQRLQALPPAPLAELALDAGYADQAHMNAEITRLAGIPPVRFPKDACPPPPIRRGISIDRDNRCRRSSGARLPVPAVKRRSTTGAGGQAAAR